MCCRPPVDDPLRHRFDYGPSDFDQHHRFVGLTVWVLPAAKGNDFCAVFAWQLGGVVSAQTGRPFTVLQGQEISAPALEDRATFIRRDPYAQGPEPAAPGSIWQQQPTACVLATKAHRLVVFGNTGKTDSACQALYSCGHDNGPRLPITERRRLEFRAESSMSHRANFMMTVF